MILEEYIQVIDSDSIRMRGHRIELDAIIRYYNDGWSPEAIVHELPTLSLVQVYAAITYYLHNKEAVDVYRANRTSKAEIMYQTAKSQTPDPLVERIRKIQNQRLSDDAA